MPFAAVTRFQPQHSIDVLDTADRTALTELVDQQVGSANLMAAVKVSGVFESIRTRTVERQHRPYPRFTDVARDEVEQQFHDVGGTLAGFRMPGWVQGISVAGYHLHFIDDDRRHGGHVLDYQIRRGTVEVEVCSALHLRLPRTPQFEGADLSDDDVAAEIHRTEGS